jgi:hypothetical protein
MLKTLLIRFGYFLTGFSILYFAVLGVWGLFLAGYYIVTGNSFDDGGFEYGRVAMLGVFAVISGFVGVFTLGANGKIRNW